MSTRISWLEGYSYLSNANALKYSGTVEYERKRYKFLFVISLSIIHLALKGVVTGKFLDTEDYL